MSDKDLLRITRKNTVINGTSKRQEKDVHKALGNVLAKLHTTFDVTLSHDAELKLSRVVEHLGRNFTEDEFHYHFETSTMRPDGGILWIQNNMRKRFPILISEVKNQGTNDLRIKEGKEKQSKGNAIERLGKNVIGFRTYCLTEHIFPFVCFGYGCDFANGSSILDRVSTIAMFGRLNTTYLHNSGPFNRGSFYFRQQKWSVDEMTDIMYDIAEKSIYYYFSKYGAQNFVR